MQDDISSSNELNDINLSLGTGPASGMCDIAEAYIFTIMSTSSNLILKNFPAVITLDGIPSVAMFSLFFLEQSLPASVDKLWPGLFRAAVKAVVLGFYPENQEDSNGIGNHSFYAPDDTSVDINLDANESSTVVAAFSFFLKLAPFHVLIPAIICFDEILLSDSEMQKLLMDKLSESGAKGLMLELQFVLFWMYQLQQNVENIPVLRVRKLSSLYIVLLNHIFSLLLASELSKTCSRSGMFPSAGYIYEAIKVVFSQPAVITSWTCSFSFSVTSFKQSDLDKSLTLFRRVPWMQSIRKGHASNHHYHLCNMPHRLDGAKVNLEVRRCWLHPFTTFSSVLGFTADVYHLSFLLCLLLPHFANVSAQASDTSVHDTAVSALLRISPPPEANPAWRWSFYLPWMDLTSEKTDLEEMAEYHACQTLLVGISNKMVKRSKNSWFLSAQDVEEFGLFEWEKELIRRSDSFTNPTL